jgi:hypothetical protein
MEKSKEQLNFIVNEWYELADAIDPERFSCDSHLDISNRDYMGWEKNLIRVKENESDDNTRYYKQSESDDYFFKVDFYEDGAELSRTITFETEDGLEEVDALMLQDVAEF